MAWNFFLEKEFYGDKSVVKNLSSVADQYFSSARPEVASMVPWGVERVLDVGCGFGGLAPLIRAREAQKIYGIEINPRASEQLKKAYDRFWIGDVETIDLSCEEMRFDCIIFADVLEHLIDPWGALKKYTQYLAPNGVIVASIPNVQNLGLIYRLLFQGLWTYSDSGLLDKTHLRFFTRKEIEALFIDSELKIELMSANRDQYSFLRSVITAIPRLLIPDLEVCQFLIIAKKTNAI